MNILCVGINGKMGKALINCAENHNCKVVLGIDKVAHPTINTVDSVSKINVKFDVIVDFSRPQSLDVVIECAKKFKTPVVFATTGYTAEQDKQITQLSKIVPVIKAGNYSLGVNILQEITERVAKVLSDFDIEIIESHHRQKVDAPSGTALMLRDSALAGSSTNKKTIFGREGNTGVRGNEIAVHSVRGGTIVGEHSVVFCGDDEIITLTHTALSRNIFANGAIKSAQWLIGKAPKMYSVKEVLC